VSRLLETVDPAEDWGTYELLRLRRALTLDALPDIASNPAVPEGGLVRALADELGVTVEALLEWGAAQDDAELAPLLV
jgi:hypothetical protein